MAKEKRDILFLCQFFYPEYNSSATLPFDTARYLAAQGFTVDALVGYPKEYSAEKHLPLRESVEGDGIRRMRYVQLGRVGKLSRLINYFSFTVQALLHTRLLRNYRAVLVYSNPPVLPLAPIWAKKRFGTRFVFVAYDIYPEIAHATGALRPGGAVSRMMDMINRALYRRVDRVVALTDEMRRYLLAQRQGLSAERTVTIANWAHEKRCVPTPAAYARFGYPEGQFVVSYFGNMGTCQDVETLLKAAELMRDEGRVRFLIVGHGNKKPAVELRIRERGLKNVLLLDFLTGEDFEQAVAVSSCCVVSLERGLHGLCAPSKYYSYLQGGQPVLAVVERESYLTEEIECERIGRSVELGDGEGLRQAILALLDDPEGCASMGARAAALYEERYAYRRAMAQYEAMLRELLREEG